ncbi:F-box/WD repeat-containing protein 7-like [Patiria miniata]|uniref:F-box domain-containing protein n=1 Tax=Patiria miniata TaxID=46514 RepID=A0A914AL99_PATMI|nr:F-box/WD repeat-containing protein 7-like [Patiria miniata]
MADCGISGSDIMCESTTAASSGSLLYAVPDDIMQTILQHLRASDLCHVASCCRWLRDATNQDSLWRPLCQSRGWEHYGTTTDLAKIASYGPSEQQATGANEASHCSVTFQNDRIVTDDNTAGLTSTCRWKGVYMRADHLDKNWATNRFHFKQIPFDEEKGRCPDSNTVFVDGDLLAIYTFCKTIQVFDIRKENLQCVIPFIKSAGEIKFKDGVIVVPCFDGMAYACNARTGQTLQTMEGNWGRSIVSLFFDGELVITRVPRCDWINSKKFRDINVWCVKDGQLKCILTADPTDGDYVCYNMDYRDKIVAAAYDDDYIRVWDAKSGKCLHKLKCPGKYSDVKLGDNVIVGFSTKDDTCVSIWSQNTGECQQVIPLANTYCHPQVVNNLILLEPLTELEYQHIGIYLSVHPVKAYNLRGKLVTEVWRKVFEVTGNGSKHPFYLTDQPVEGRLRSSKGVICNATPNGLVPLCNACATNMIWIDDIRMVSYDDEERRLIFHHYW